MIDDGLSVVGLAVMRLWVMAKVKVFDAGGIRIGYMLRSASMLVNATRHMDLNVTRCMDLNVTRHMCL